MCVLSDLIKSSLNVIKVKGQGINVKYLLASEFGFNRFTNREMKKEKKKKRYHDIIP